MYSLFAMDFCSNPKYSANISLMPLNAVAPDVIGRTITPKIVSVPKKEPRVIMAILLTTSDGVPSCIKLRSVCPSKSTIVAYAQINETKPSTIIMP
jgi:hypothetical protein